MSIHWFKHFLILSWIHRFGLKMFTTSSNSTNSKTVLEKSNPLTTKKQSSLCKLDFDVTFFKTTLLFVKQLNCPNLKALSRRRFCRKFYPLVAKVSFKFWTLFYDSRLHKLRHLNNKFTFLCLSICDFLHFFP